MLLAAVGLFGILSFSTLQRAGELGVRLTLGAARREIVLAIWRSSFRLDSIPVFRARSETQGCPRARLWTTMRGESLDVEIARSARHFQLAGRPFHMVACV